MSRPTITELRDGALTDLRGRVDSSGRVRSDANVDAIVAFIDAYAWSRAEGGLFDAKKHALWRLLQTMVPTAKDSGWDGVRKNVTKTLEGAGCWERIGGEKGQQWWLRRRWATPPGTVIAPSEAVCLLLDEDGQCADGIGDPRFCARCSRRSRST